MLHLPFGHTNLLFDEDGASVFKTSLPSAGRSGREIVREAMDKPVSSAPLSELAKGKQSCTLILSDHTRPVPSRDIVPELLRDLRLGNPDIRITLLVATGFHRKTLREELVAKLGSEIVQSENIVIHDCRDEKSCAFVGTLPSGAPLYVNRLALETELLIAEGFIEPHFFAGFSGGRKSVLPGVCSQLTVLGNHCSRFIDHPLSRTGVLDGNPIHEDMLSAAKMASLAFIVNVIIDAQKNTVAAFAGDPVQAHRAGCDYLSGFCQLASPKADIVVTTNGGAPLDQNVYQCVKGLTAAEAAAREGGVLVICAACKDGAGGEGFYRSLRDCQSPAALYREIMATPQEKTIPDQWESQILARILCHHSVIFVTSPEMEQTVREMKMLYAPDLSEALRQARTLAGTNARIAVIPDGVSVIVR